MNSPKFLRQLHRWASIITALPLGVMILSGVLLQMKKEVPWFQPPTQTGTSRSPSLDLDTLLIISRTVTEAAVHSWEDIDRLDVRPDKGIVKVRAKNRWELQIDATTGQIIQSAYRRSDFIESLHDGSAFSNFIKQWIFLPSGFVALLLYGTGLYLILRRRVRK